MAFEEETERSFHFPQRKNVLLSLKIDFYLFQDEIQVVVFFFFLNFCTPEGCIFLRNRTRTNKIKSKFFSFI